MNRVEIFEDIVEIISKDYAGAEEVPYPGLHVPFLRFCSQLADQFAFEDKELHHFVQLYLQIIGDRKLAFNIQEHAGFHRFSRGFNVRSDGKDLYVTEGHPDGKVRPGDKILTIGHQPPARFRSLVSQLDQDLPLSERDSWDAYLNHAQVIEVEHEDLSREEVILKMYAPGESSDAFSCTMLDADSVYLLIRSFSDAWIMTRLLSANHALLASCSRLIIDIRGNAADDRDAILPLLTYVCDRNMSVKDFFQDDPVYTRYTGRNCDLSKAQLAPYLDSEDEQMRAMAAQLIQELDAKRGQGLVLDAEEEESGDEMIYSRRSAKEILLLTDTNCEDEAEWFALGCSRLDGVTLVGRPTRGNMDYSRLVTVDYGSGISFTYPISKTKRCHEGNGYNKTGVPVNVYIPWSRDEIREDMIMKTILDL